MKDWEFLKQVGIEIPRQITLTKDEWKDLYATMAEFKGRVMRNHGYHPKDTFHPTTGKLIKHKRSKRGG